MCKNEESAAVRKFLTKVGDKWSILLVVMLAKTPQHRARFSELQRMVDGISQRMLTTTLRNLERDGFLSREIFPEIPPRVEYELTPPWSQSVGTNAATGGLDRNQLDFYQKGQNPFR